MLGGRRRRAGAAPAGDRGRIRGARRTVGTTGSDLKASQLDGLALFTRATDNVAKVGDGKDFFAIGGHVSLDPDRGGVLADVLPPVIHVDASSSEASTIRWLLDELVKEVTTNRPGVGLASKQLAQLLFVQIIRFYLASSNTVTTGWLRALNDERIAPALRLMHGEPSRAWRLSELAKHVGMSRTSFALRFKANAGVAPLSYLQNLRMRLAEQGLREGTTSVAEALVLWRPTECRFWKKISF